MSVGNSIKCQGVSTISNYLSAKKNVHSSYDCMIQATRAFS